jgi:hypothetical protein
MQAREKLKKARSPTFQHLALGPAVADAAEGECPPGLRVGIALTVVEI